MMSETTPNQILSRHSFIKDVGHDDESEPLTLPATGARGSFNGLDDPIGPDNSSRVSVPEPAPGRPFVEAMAAQPVLSVGPTAHERYENRIQDESALEQQIYLGGYQLDLAALGAFQGDSGDFNFEIHSLGFSTSPAPMFDWLGRAQG